MSIAKIIALHKALGGSGSGGGTGGVTVVSYVDYNKSAIQMKASDLLTACQNGIVFVKLVDEYEQDTTIYCNPIILANCSNDMYTFSAGGSTYRAGSGDNYPTAGDPK